MRKSIIMAMWMILLVIPLVIGVETPLFGVEFRGTALVNGTPVVDGTTISVWANNGTLKMDSVIAKEGIGYFHHLEIMWDNPDTVEDEGVLFGDNAEEIMFMIGEVKAVEKITVGVDDKGSTIDLVLTSGTEELSEEESLVGYIPWILLGILAAWIILYILHREDRNER